MSYVPYGIRLRQARCVYCNHDHQEYGVEIHYTFNGEGFCREACVDSRSDVLVGRSRDEARESSYLIATDPDNFSDIHCGRCEMPLLPECWEWLPSAPPGQREGEDMIEKRCFQYTSGSHNKFWTVQVRGKFFFATWGRIGTAGQTQPKEFPSPRAAMEHASKMIGEKTSKGYTEVAASKHAGAPDTMLAAAGGGGSSGGSQPSRVAAPVDDEVQVRGLDL